MDITAYRLRELRGKIGLSQREVAERIGVTRAAYNKYECGASKPIRRLDELSALFGVSADYILGKNETDFESEVNDVNPKTHAQLKKYIGLSDFGKEIVDITLDAVFEREKRISKTNV